MFESIRFNAEKIIMEKRLFKAVLTFTTRRWAQICNRLRFVAFTCFSNYGNYLLANHDDRLFVQVVHMGCAYIL